MADDVRSGNVSSDSLSTEEKRNYENVEKIETGNDDRGFFEKLSDMWNQDRGLFETFDPEENILNDEQYQWPYLVHGSELQCEFGSHPRKLRLPKSHGDYLTGHASVHEDDCIVGEDQNIPFFGVCSSTGHPGKNNMFLFGGIADTFSSENIILEIEEKDAEGNVISVSNVKGLPCVACIIENWKRTDPNKQLATNDSYISGEDGFNRDFKNTCTQKSFLICKYLGRIKPTENIGHETREVESESDEEQMSDSVETGTPAG